MWHVFCCFCFLTGVGKKYDFFDVDAGIRTDVRVEQLEPQPAIEDCVSVIWRPKFMHRALFS